MTSDLPRPQSPMSCLWYYVSWNQPVTYTIHAPGKSLLYVTLFGHQPLCVKHYRLPDEISEALMAFSQGHTASKRWQGQESNPVLPAKTMFITAILQPLLPDLHAQFCFEMIRRPTSWLFLIYYRGNREGYWTAEHFLRLAHLDQMPPPSIILSSLFLT